MTMDAVYIIKDYMLFDNCKNSNLKLQVNAFLLAKFVIIFFRYSIIPLNASARRHPFATHNKDA